MPPAKPIPSGTRVGRLVVIAQQKGERRHLCRCDCGTVKAVTDTNLRRQITRSCGCLRREMVAAKNTKHGGGAREDRSPEYNVWKQMRQRCGNPNAEKFPQYGGRGIKVCARWDDFAAFCADVGPRPSPSHSIDRIDNDGHYEPDNVRWATPRQQARNRRANVRVEYQGRRVLLADLAEQRGVSAARVQVRLRKGWPIERALSTPGAAPARVIEHGGEKLTIRGWAKRLGISESVLRGRLDAGWAVEKALAAPVAPRSPRKIR